MTGREARRCSRIQRRRSPTVVYSRRPILKKSGPVPIWPTSGQCSARSSRSHTVGVRDSLEAINGIGHAAVMTNPEFRTALAEHGLTLDPETGEVVELAPSRWSGNCATGTSGGERTSSSSAAVCRSR
jgi:hypothetical protein